MNLKEKYQQKIVPQLVKDWRLTNPLAVPKVVKVMVIMGLGEAAQDKKVLVPMSRDLAALTGQKPLVTRARRAIAGFKLRKNDPIGLVVTLRGKKMDAFLEKLFTVVLPRLRDFQGVPLSGFDGHGNYNLGIPEQTVFMEVDHTQVEKVRGLQITLVTNTQSDQKAQTLLAALGMPFVKKKNGKKSKNH